MISIVTHNRYQNCNCDMNKMKKSATEPISSQNGQKKPQFNVVPVKPKGQEDKPWKLSNSSVRIPVSISKGNSNSQRNELTKAVKVNKFQASENGRLVPDNIKFEGMNEKTAPEKMLKQIQTLTARSIGNQMDAKRIHDLMQQLKEQLSQTADIHKSRTEEVRQQQEYAFNELLNEKNAEIIKLELQVEEISEKLKGRHDQLKSESIMMKKELHQLKEILKVRCSQVDHLKEALIDAHHLIETLEIQKERALDAAAPMETVQADEMDEHLEIISKALRSNKKILQFIEIETIT